jgi:hypothetical protein
MALNDLNEECRAVLNRFGEDLKEVALIIKVDQNVEALQNIQILFNLEGGVSEALPQVGVVRLGNLKELKPSFLLNMSEHKLNGGWKDSREGWRPNG